MFLEKVFKFQLFRFTTENNKYIDGNNANLKENDFF